MEEKKGFFSRHKLLTLIIILLLALSAYRIYVHFAQSKLESEVLPISVRVEAASMQDINVTAPVTGRIQPAEDVPIVPLAQGQVTKVNVKIGDKVKAGTVLFEIDSSALAASYTAAANAYSRMQTLYNEGAVSAQDLESVRAQYSQLAEQISFYKVTSPIDGYVTSLNVSVGSVAGGSMAGSVANIDSFIIETKVSEALAPSIHVGDPVEVYVASADKNFTGSITAFSPIPSLGTLTYPLTITMDPSDDLFAGMFAEVHIISESVPETLCIRSEAVMLKDGKTQVVILDDEDIPTTVEVVTGVDNGTLVQILSGVKKGDRVIWSGQQYITDGIKVRVVE
jgi:RND family efflux transporter MFP subunit